MMRYTKRKRRKHLKWRLPVKRAHGEMIVGSVPTGELGLVILKGEERVSSVEALVVLTVTAFHFAVVAGRIGANELVADA